MNNQHINHMQSLDSLKKYFNLQNVLDNKCFVKNSYFCVLSKVTLILVN